MKNLDIDSLHDGMVLARPVLDHHAMILFNQGMTLTEKTIYILKSWGIRDVWIAEQTGVSAPAADTSSLGSEGLTDDGPDLAGKFCDVLDDPLMAEIMRVAEGLLLKRRTSSD